MTHDELMDTVIQLVRDDDGGGICTACHAIASNVEPDGEGQECEACGESQVTGADMWLLRHVA